MKRRLADWVVRHLLERGDRIETRSEARLEEFGLADPERVLYVASGRFALPRVLRRIGVGRDDVFIDFGSGKGRVLYQAARFPFKRVIGVEIAEELNSIARYNIDHNRDRLACRDVEIVTADAVEYEVPDDVTIAYFFHPFHGETFARVIDNLVASLDRNPRRLRLIYVFPELADRILRTGRFELERRMKAPAPTLRSWHDILIFGSRPPR